MDFEEEDINPRFVTPEFEYPKSPVDIIVNIHNIDNRKILPREVWVRESDAVPLTFAYTRDNRLSATARLSQLLPAVLENDSPIKEIGGRIYREGKTSTASRVQLGTVAAIASDELPPQLRMDGLDKIILFPNEHGDYECELFWDGVIPSPALSGSHDVATRSTQEVPKSNDKNPHTKAALKASIAKAVRHQVVLDATNHLEDLGWAKTGGGYQIPEDHDEFPDMKFTKEDVFKVLKLGHSQGNAYGSLFNPRTVAKLPKVQAWIKDPAGKVGDRFRNMTISEFRRYQEDHLHLRRPKDAKGKGKKRVSAEDTSDDEDSVGPLRLKKGKGRHVPNLSDLDMSDE
ncbi:hypothetical protein PILCRDRAFT_9853 [Piloderma croceum F 1598]|uniref:Uncharacterized protein n=1 Tax=Piloderma croceum (strain F 1598) TaxID=765440 RepID=A0A0C3FJI2_PILCF|nr:hypothetical protein PILCRDRAFT_9853 [Piloderma croceum F 1598]